MPAHFTDHRVINRVLHMVVDIYQNKHEMQLIHEAPSGCRTGHLFQLQQMLNIQDETFRLFPFVLPLPVLCLMQLSSCSCWAVGFFSAHQMQVRSTDPIFSWFGSCLQRQMSNRLSRWCKWKFVDSNEQKSQFCCNLCHKSDRLFSCLSWFRKHVSWF